MASYDQAENGSLDAVFGHDAKYDHMVDIQIIHKPVCLGIGEEVAVALCENDLLELAEDLKRHIDRVIAEEENPFGHQREGQFLLAAGTVDAMRGETFDRVAWAMGFETGDDR